MSLRPAKAFARIWLAAAVAATAIAAAAAEPARNAEDIAVEAALQGNSLAINARATIRAPLPVIWRTLTDYDHLAQFIPGMKSSRMLERRGSTVTVEQIGEAGLLIFRCPIAVVVESDEHYPATIAVPGSSHRARRLASGGSRASTRRSMAPRRDAGAYRIPGSPYLRADRFLASFREEVKDDPARFDAWIDRLGALDPTARSYELRNLPAQRLGTLGVADRNGATVQTASCAARLRRADLASGPPREALVERAAVPDDYVDWQRVVGIYPLATSPFFDRHRSLAGESADVLPHRGGRRARGDNHPL